MKLLHIADIHLGRRMDEYSLYDDQKHIMKQIVDIALAQAVDAVLMAGDIYDRSVPSTEAVGLLEEFLVTVSQHNIPVYLISGNHDSPERLAFAHQLMRHSNIFISPSYEGKVEPLTLKKNQEAVDIFLLPFLKPALVRKYFPEQEIDSYTTALQVAISQMTLSKDHPNILLAHQFVTGSSTCDSEELSVGGSDQVDLAVFEGFDYVALGHLHSPQKVGRETVRYSGSPLKYSFSEVSHKKCVTIVDTADHMAISTVPLVPLRDLQDLKGTYLDLTAKSFYQNKNLQDFFRITLTDEEDIPDGLFRLRSIYPNLLKLRYDNQRTQKESDVDHLKQAEQESPFQLFSRFYQEQNGGEFSPEQASFLQELINSIWEEAYL